MAVGGGHTFALPLSAARFLVFDTPQGLRELGSQRPAAVSPRVRELVSLNSGDIRDEPLGARQIGNVDATGRRITMTIPAGQSGNELPVTIVEERWESPDLKLLLYARCTDPRSGVIEYPGVQHPPDRAAGGPLRGALRLRDGRHQQLGALDRARTRAPQKVGAGWTPAIGSSRADAGSLSTSS